MQKLILEFTEEDLKPIESFKIKSNLCPIVWDNFKIKNNIREVLLDIARYFYDNSGIKGDIRDIVLTGSVANYNWSRTYSDFDLHIIVDLNKVNSDTELVKKTADLARKEFNLTHDIKIYGLPVEVYIQDSSEINHATGVFSLMKNRWNLRPIKGALSDSMFDREKIKRKAIDFMENIDSVYQMYDDKTDLESIKDKTDLIWNKIKETRKDSLDEDGEMSTGNLVFKLLRRNGYIEKIIEMKRMIFTRSIANKLKNDDK